MTSAGLLAKLSELLSLPAETEWVEFKQNHRLRSISGGSVRPTRASY